MFKPEQTEKVQMLYQRISVITNWEMNARRATRCRFIYWHKLLNPVFLGHIVANKMRLNQMNYYLMALQGGAEPDPAMEKLIGLPPQAQPVPEVVEPENSTPVVGAATADLQESGSVQ